MTFQALSAMTTIPGYDGFDDFDPSDEGEIARIQERTKDPEDAISEHEQSFIQELGIDAEFFRTD